MPSIFISYRISDSNDITGRICDRLRQRFGAEEVFRDESSIRGGKDYREDIDQALNACQVMVVVIGPHWLNAMDAEGNRRLDQPDDWVRREIETALRREIVILPLLVNNTPQPAAEALPKSLSPLAYRQNLLARSSRDFEADMARLIERLGDLVPDVQTFSGVPNNLPRSGTVKFVGRETDLADLHTQLHQSDRIAITALRGMGGIGKTELALQYARCHRDQGTYPGGICWLQAREQDVASQIVRFAKQAGMRLPEGELAEQVNYVWANWPLSPSAMLVVYDDVADFATIQPYLPPQTVQFRVLLTTRQHFSGIASLEIDVLSPEAALDLLRSIVCADRINAQLDETIALGVRLGHLPLALELVGRYLELDKDLTLDEVQVELDEMRTCAYALLKDESAATMTSKLGVAEAFELSLRRLDDTSQTLATLLCLFAATPIDWEWVQACLPELSQPTLRQQRNKLLQNSLLQRVGSETYQLHPLIQEFLRVRFADASGTAPLQQGYCAVMSQAAKQISPTQTQDAIVRLTPLIPHLEAVATTWHSSLADEDIVSPANRIGLFYYSQGAFQTAEPWFEMALKMGRDRLGNAHSDVATSLNNLALLCKVQGRYTEAEPLYQQALALRKQLLGDAHPDVASSLNNLGMLYQSQGRYTEAEPLYQEALTLRKQLLGDAHPDVAVSLNNLALLYESQGRYGEAESLFQEALQLRTQLLGNAHPDVANGLNNLATLYKSQGRYSEAEPLFQEALRLGKQLLGDTHPDVVASLSNLAGLYELQGRYTEAEPLFQETLALRKQLLGDTQPDVATSLNNLGMLYQSQGRYSEAETHYQEALALWKQLFRAHPNAAASLNNLAELYRAQGRYTEAEPLLQEALALLQQLLGNDHPDVAASLNNLGLLYQSQGRYSEVEPLFQEALRIKKQLLGETHPDFATSLNNLASLYEAQGRFNEAEPLYQKVLVLRQSLLGNDHPDVASSINNLAVLYAKLGLYQRAEPLLVHALEILQRSLGPDHPYTQSTQQSLENVRSAINA